MKGNVDEGNRALITISVSNNLNGECENVVAWIDTAFDGHLVFSANLIEQLKLESLVETEAILADGSKVALETYICFIGTLQSRPAPRFRFIALALSPLLGVEVRDARPLCTDLRLR